jgi:hypothetical protein
MMPSTKDHAQTMATMLCALIQANVRESRIDRALCSALRFANEPGEDVIRHARLLAEVKRPIDASASEIVTVWGAMFATSGRCERVGVAVRELEGGGAHAWLLLTGLMGKPSEVLGLPVVWRDCTWAAVDPCVPAGMPKPSADVYVLGSETEADPRIDWVLP